MKRVIVTTTINAPTRATLAFAGNPDWTLVVVGDRKTPHADYEAIDCVYLSPETQEERYPDLCEVTPWNSIQRRNVGFVEAYRMGADVIATVDDDNIPYPDWGADLHVGQEIDVDLYEPEAEVFDPLSVTDAPQVWHRGFPIELLGVRDRVTYMGKRRRKVLVQADLWDGDPDIDAIARLSLMPIVKYSVDSPYAGSCVAPFNSQNTFLAREVLPYYAVLPFVGRMDDIWGAYVLQAKFPDCVVYNRASVYQDRNEQDLVTNLEREVLGYRHTLEFIRSGADLDSAFVPETTRRFYEVYRAQFE